MYPVFSIVIWEHRHEDIMNGDKSRCFVWLQSLKFVRSLFLHVLNQEITYPDLLLSAPKL